MTSPARTRARPRRQRRSTCSHTIVGCRRFVHVSLFRDRDRTLLSGDALITVKQESAIAVATQRRSMHGPPAYFTQDWPAAERSVRRLAALEPETLLPGHGEAWSGPGMRSQLRGLVAEFASREVPAFGRYSRQPAVTDDHGIVSLPPDPLPKTGCGAGARLASLGLSAVIRRD